MLSKWSGPGITFGRTDYKVDLGGPILVQEVESQVYQSQRRVAITVAYLISAESTRRSRAKPEWSPIVSRARFLLSRLFPVARRRL